MQFVNISSVKFYNNWYKNLWVKIHIIKWKKSTAVRNSINKRNKIFTTLRKFIKKKYWSIKNNKVKLLKKKQTI